MISEGFIECFVTFGDLALTYVNILHRLVPVDLGDGSVDLCRYKYPECLVRIHDLVTTHDVETQVRPEIHDKVVG